MRVRRFVLPNTAINSWMRLKCALSYLYAYLPIGYLLVCLHTMLKTRKTYKYEASLCLIFRDEAPYLKEWLEYHTLIGIDHFYLYNNNSTDNFADVLKPYVRDGRVTLLDWPQNYSQVEAYRHCYNVSKTETHWLGFIDTDEFLNLSVKAGNNLKKFLGEYNAYPSLFLFWRMFGTSGIMTEDTSIPVTERYTSCWPYLSNHGKSFINNDYAFKTINLHWHIATFLGLPLYGVAVNKMFCPYMEVLPPFCRISPVAYINHYWSKSRANAIYKSYVRSDACARELEVIRKKNGLDFFELQCSDKDFSIQRWSVNLKEAMSVDK